VRVAYSIRAEYVLTQRDTEIFICDACNTTVNAVCHKEEHTDAHPLVRLSVSAAIEGNAIESRLLALEARFKEDWQAMSERIGSLEKNFDGRLAALESKVDGRLAAVEKLLSFIASKHSS
jgi:hypothetical protein